jgi:Protein of unknown function (DUF2849)
MTAPQQQKLRVNGPVVITGNRLSDGAVVYRTQGDGWSMRLEDAIVVTTAEEATRLLASSTRDYLHAVGIYVAPVTFEGRDVKPGNLRERIRLRGPTIALPAEAEV